MVGFHFKVIVGHLTQNKSTEFDEITNEVIYQSVLEVYRCKVYVPPTNMSLLNVNILVSSQSCALKFSIYIPPTAGDNFIPNLMFCDEFNFIAILPNFGTWLTRPLVQASINYNRIMHYYMVRRALEYLMQVYEGIDSHEFY